MKSRKTASVKDGQVEYQRVGSRSKVGRADFGRETRKEKRNKEYFTFGASFYAFGVYLTLTGCIVIASRCGRSCRLEDERILCALYI